MMFQCRTSRAVLSMILVQDFTVQLGRLRAHSAQLDDTGRLLPSPPHCVQGCAQQVGDPFPIRAVSVSEFSVIITIAARGDTVSGTTGVTCITIMTGYFGNVSSLTVPTCSGACPPGTYSPTPGSLQCFVCPAGKFSPVATSTVSCSIIVKAKGLSVARCGHHTRFSIYGCAPNVTSYYCSLLGWPSKRF